MRLDKSVTGVPKNRHVSRLLIYDVPVMLTNGAAIRATTPHGMILRKAHMGIMVEQFMITDSAVDPKWRRLEKQT